MNLGQRCACGLCFIMGIIFTLIFNEMSNSGQRSINLPYISSTCDIFKSLTNLEASVNKLMSKSDSRILPEPKTKNSSSEQKLRTQLGDKKLLCWVLTGPKNHKSRALNVKNTWGKRCDKLLFMSTVYDSTLPTTVVKGAKEGRNGLWSKTRGAFKHIYQNYLQKFDFFLKADDDTYMIVENLRYFLKDYNSSIPYFFGCLFELYNKKKNSTSRWNSGGAGYVLSKAALTSLVEKGYKHSKCKRSLEGGAEDLNLAQCLEVANVTFVDTRDDFGRYRFNAFKATTHLTPGESPKWWKQYVKYPQKSEMDCCSEYAVSFHYMSPKDMILYEYLLYHVRPYGVNQS